MSLLDAVVVETGPEPLGAVIWLHGLGADGHDFEAIIPELQLPDSMPLRFVFPHAPVRPVTINGGMAMRAWYDIRSFDAEGRADSDGVTESSAALDDLIAREVARGIPTTRIVLAGFSQGGAVVLHNALRASERLAGLLALSTYLPLPNGFTDEVTNNRNSQDRSLPIFMAHGTEDPMVPLQAGIETATTLRAAGFTVEWHEYPMAHGICPAEIVDIRNWLLGIYAG
ncbi:MAG TPA: alpha/beta fold hydrolase [Woeseiaceae bacterium]|nr:alpha/beta fold hydrolase [Woeseiaceae bacterium]